jgi:purine-binding chemotaxis protein CheW
MADAEHRVDWDLVRERLAAAGRRLERGYEPDGAEERRVLAARARALARESVVSVDVGDSIEVVEFRLGDERYAVETTFVREVYPVVGLTPVPCTPPFVLGVISVRGQILSVVDLKIFYGLPPGEVSARGQAVILRAAALELGVLADKVIGVRPLARTDLHPPPTQDSWADYVLGVTGERLVVLAGDKLLADARLIVREEVGNG